MKPRTKKIGLWLIAIGFLIGLILGALLANYFNPCRDLPTDKVETVTVVVRDTIKVPVPTPIDKGVVKVEKVKPKNKPVDEPKGDEGTNIPTEPRNEQNDAPTIADDGEIEIPIERKEYVTEDYKAVVEGWRPSLVSMEVYPKTTTITNTVTKVKTPRFSLVVGPGIGYDGKNFKPYLGVTAGFVIFSK